jgi:hypothetical protein
VEQERAHDQGRDGVPEDHGQHPLQRQQAEASTSAGARLGCLGSTRAAHRQLPAGARRQRKRDVRRDSPTVPAAARVDLPRRRHVACQRQVHAGLRPAVGLLLTVIREVRRVLVPRSERANSGSGGQPGRLAFAGDRYGANSFGAPYPEDNWYGGIAPRLGGVYNLNDKTVVRRAGASSTPRRSTRAGAAASRRTASRRTPRSARAGRRAAGLLSRSGPATDLYAAADHRDDYDNGKGILYRPPTPTSVRTRTSGTSRWIASSVATSR